MRWDDGVAFFDQPNVFWDLSVATPTAPLSMSATFQWTTGVGTYAQPVPAAPVNLTAAAVSASQINVTLPQPNSAATQTEWSYKLTSSGVWLVAATTAASTTSLPFVGLIAATSYDFRARYNGLNGFSTYSNTATVSTGAMPSVPVLSLTVNSSTQITVSMSVFPANATSVALQRSLDGITFSALTTLNSPTLSVADTGLSASTLYYYRAASTGPGGTSAFSTPVSAATPSVGGVLFSDNFAAGLTKQLNGQNFWGGGNTGPLVPFNCAAFPSPLGSTTCLRAGPFLSVGGDVSELDYFLGGPVNQLFIRLYVYYPSGLESPSIGPAWGRSNTSSTNNNKLFRWGEATTWAGSGDRIGMSTYATSSGAATGCDRAFFEIPGSQAFNQPGYSGRDTPVSLGNKAAGRWIKLEAQVVPNTTTPTWDASNYIISNGVLRFWVDDVMVSQLTNVGMGPAGVTIQCGYIFGAQNLGPDINNSYFYFTDVAFSTVGRV